MKEEITFLVDWGKNKEIAWSGTNWSIYQALSRHYEMKDVNLKMPFLVKAVRKVLHINPYTWDFYWAKFLRMKVRKYKGKVFQFTNLRASDARTKTFVYQDLSWSYVKHMQETLPEVFAMSGFQAASQDIAEKQTALQNEYYKNCTAIFVMGHWIKNFLCANGIPAEKIFTVGGGINCDISAIRPAPKTNTKVLFIGRDFKRKGGFITYEAFRLLRERGENVELYVAGPKSDLIERPADGYHFLGDVPYSRCAELYNTCDIFCMPSYFEAYGLVFAEALAFGLPCIGRNCYEMPYFIENGKSGCLLEKDDPEELADKMLRLLKDEQIRQYVLSHREHYLKEYSWESVADRMKTVIDSV